MTPRQHMAGKKAPCHVWKGNNRLRGLHEGKRLNLSFLRSRLCVFSSGLDRNVEKSSRPTLFGLHLRG